MKNKLKFYFIFSKADLVPDAPTISLPHAASVTQRDDSSLSDTNNNNNILEKKTNSNNERMKLNQSKENKWTKMSACILSNSETTLSNIASNSINNTQNKWIDITNTIIGSSLAETKKTNKRLTSPKLNEYVEQEQQSLKWKKRKSQQTNSSPADWKVN